jgi:hypothetical protein
VVVALVELAGVASSPHLQARKTPLRLSSVTTIAGLTRVNESQLLQSLPSKARTHIVSEPAAVPPLTQIVARSEAATSMVVFAGLCRCWASRKSRCYQPFRCPRTDTSSPHRRRRRTTNVTCAHSLM